jgi:hypothetical protein
MDDLRSGIERWTNEGGHIGTEATSYREMVAGHDAPSPDLALTIRAPVDPGRGDVRLGLENWAC